MRKRWVDDVLEFSTVKRCINTDKFTFAAVIISITRATSPFTLSCLFVT